MALPAVPVLHSVFPLGRQERNYHIFYQLLSDDKMATGSHPAAA
jgi:hypothetical protein